MIEIAENRLGRQDLGKSLIKIKSIFL